jgi:hypothetical protein
LNKGVSVLSAVHRIHSATLGATFVLGLFLAAPVLEAQVLYGSIVGNVTDNTGAALPGATVTITHAQTGTAREAITDGTGAYRFPTLQPGAYTVDVKLEGFSNATRSDVVVSLNSVTRIDMALQIGQLTETVTVEATSPVLQTDRAEVRAELTSRELTNLPVPLGRNYQHLFKTIPGFTPPADAHSVPSNPSRALTFNVNGSSQSTNNTRIDGVSTTNIWLPHVAAYVPALESLETVNVVTNSFDAEQGLAGGAAINVQIKSGTNQLRGSAFEYHTNERLRSLDYFAPPGTPKGEWRYNQFGGTVGGPVVRNKLFYFVSYEATRDRHNVSQTYSVPTEPLRRGDFSASVNPIFDPMTGTPDGFGRTPFANNIIPQDRIDPIVMRMIPLLPLPNLVNADGSIPEQNNYFVQAPFIFNRWTVDSKVNYNATSNLNFFGRYSILDFFQDNATAFGEQLQGQPIGGGNPGIGTGKTHSLSGGFTYTLSSNLVLDAHVGWVRMNTGVAQTDVNENKGLDWLGIPGTNGPRPFEGGMPRFGVGGFAPWGVTETYMPYYRSDDQIQNVVNMNWVKGRHNIRFGTDIYYQAMNHTQPEFIGTSYGARGGFDFGSGPTVLRGGAGGNFFNNWATFLLGLPTQLGRLNEVVAPYTTRNWHYSVYARDQWQATSKLTLSYGTRWEYFPIPTRADRGMERYNWRTNMMEIGGVGSVPTDLGVKISKTMFAPRVGMAYRATPSTVFRAGYGLTNDPYALARPMRTNHPILLNLIEQSEHAWAWVRPLREGISPIPDPDIGNGIIPVPGNVSAFTLPDEFDRGYIHSWNTAVQRELRWGFVGEAAYVATRQSNQLGYRELNWSPIGGGQAGRQLNQQFGRTAQTRLVAPIGNTSYHSLQSKLERRFSQGLQLGVNYTYSRAKGIAGAPNSDNAPRIQIPEFYHLNYGISDINRPHSFHVTNLTELPFGAGQRWLNNGIASALAGGWMINNIVSFFSGTPFNVTSAGTSLNAPESQQRADLVGPIRILGGTGRGNPYFDPLSFAPVTEARFGTAPWNVMEGPGFWRWDFGLFREFRILNQRSLQFRFEGFNLLNTPRFNNPGGNVSSLQMNPDGSIANLNGFSEITGTAGGSERLMRFGLRLGF